MPFSSYAAIAGQFFGPYPPNNYKPGDPIPPWINTRRQLEQYTGLPFYEIPGYPFDGNQQQNLLLPPAGPANVLPGRVPPVECTFNMIRVSMNREGNSQTSCYLRFNVAETDETISAELVTLDPALPGFNFFTFDGDEEPIGITHAEPEGNELLVSLDGEFTDLLRCYVEDFASGIRTANGRVCGAVLEV